MGIALPGLAARDGRGFTPWCAATRTFIGASSPKKGPPVNLVISARPVWGAAFAHYLSARFGDPWLFAPVPAAGLVPTAAILDAVHLPGAFLTLRRTVFQFPTARVVAVVARASDYVAVKAREAGCHAILSESDDLHAWERVLERLPIVAFQLGPSFAQAPRFRELLTRRQAAVYEAVLRGLSDEEIALDFGITVATAETHRRDMQLKLGCHGHTEVVTHGLRHGVVDVSDLPVTAPMRRATRRHCATR